MTNQENGTMDASGGKKHLEYFEGLAPGRAAYRKRFAYYYDDIARYCGYFIHSEASVLEVGCGTGELLNDVPGRRKVGIDFSPRMVAEARKQFPALEFRVMDAEKLELNETFDVILLSNLVGFLDDVQQVLEGLHRVCHARTKIILTYHNHLWEPLLSLAERISFKAAAPVQNWLSRQDLENMLFLAGFEVYKVIPRMLVPFRIPLVSSFINRYIGSLPGFRHFAINQYVFARSNRPAAQAEHSVSVVIPARNESGNIENAVKRMPAFGRSVEIIFVEGNSTDDTWDVIQAVAAKYKDTHRIVTAKQEGKGKGDAVRKGFGLATGDILMILDADLTVVPEALPRFYEAMERNQGDFIMGTRLVYPMESQAMRFLNMLGNRFFSMVFSWLLDQPLKDTLCGTKVLFRTDYERLVKNREFFGEFDPFGDYDLIFGAFKLNLKIVEVPIRYQARTYGETNISRFRHGFLLLQMCLFAARKIKWY
jgi:SAM-dependent methyltransferase